MTKFLHDDVLDAPGNYVKTNCNKMVACSAYPTTYTEANATYALADVTMASGDFTLANGDVSGRKVTVAEKTGVNVDASGTYTHLAHLDTVNSKVLAVTDGTSQPLVAANTITIPAHDIEVRDPA
jgi:hypothetical protein